ncbi:MBL fold metallo-hydrolase [Allisonella histaminiformans]|uniref:MBL fold metallo-hydrolase n=1 Tax=Allisonella histaminiformans TaxID=209880 RepID=UPI003F8BB62F
MKTFQLNDYTLHVFFNDAVSFFVTMAVLEKDGHAAMVNTGFTQSAARKVSHWIKEKGIILDKVFITHFDPDYYFGLETVIREFPEVIAYASQETVDKICTSLSGKLDAWKNVLKEDAPVNPVIPKAMEKGLIDFLGVPFIFSGETGRINLWDEKNRVLLGGIDTFNEIHVFLADTGSREKLEAWIKRLDVLDALHPEILIPSHAVENGTFDTEALIHTREYLKSAIDGISRAENSRELTDFLLAAYPDRDNKGVVELGAKVLMGELQWG